MRQGLSGLRVVSFESRRAAEVAELVRNYGGEPISAPSMREIPLTEQREALAFGETLLAGGCDIVILLTGVGTRMLIAALSARWPTAQVVAALRRTQLVCRGPKPIAALKEAGLTPALAVPEPNTWHELLSELDLKLPVAGKRVAVQEYGVRNEALLAELERRQAQVIPVRVYGWGLPEDIAPLRAAIERLVARQADVALFTSSSQVDNLFRVATDMGRADALHQALQESTVVATIGPVTTDALQGHGLEPDVCPEHPKMGHLLAAIAAHGADLLARKRGKR